MTSLHQTTDKQQEVSVLATIEPKTAVNSTAKTAKKMREAQAKSTNRTKLLISMSIEFIDYSVGRLRDCLMEKTATDQGVETYEALVLIEVAQDCIKTMSKKPYQDYDDCVADFSRIETLIKAVDKTYSKQDGTSAVIKRHIPIVDVLLEMIEITQPDEVLS